MTATQSARTRGFRASLTQRGVSVSLKSKDAEYEALHKPVVPEGENKPLSQEVRTADELHILREDVLAEDETIEVGDVFLSEDGGTSFRVALITDNPINIAVIYTCETAPILE